MMDTWHTLRAFTQARIAQGSAGCGQRTASLLDFQIAHAEARDAVLKEWDSQAFLHMAQERYGAALMLATQASSRDIYLQRPDLGRKLSPESLARLVSATDHHGHDVALAVSNGLSTTAVERHALPLLDVLIEYLKFCALTTSPVLIIPDGRVALSDEIGKALKAKVSLILIGERPGLSAADSLGAYITLSPAAGNTDAERNCISNIRQPDGLSYATAAGKIGYLIRKGLKYSIRGVALKDDSPESPDMLAATIKALGR